MQSGRHSRRQTRRRQHSAREDRPSGTPVRKAWTPRFWGDLQEITHGAVVVVAAAASWCEGGERKKKGGDRAFIGDEKGLP